MTTIEDLQARQAEAADPATPAGRLDGLAHAADGDWDWGGLEYYGLELAKNPSAPADLLAELAALHHPRVTPDRPFGLGWGVAQNPSAAPDTLRDLARDEALQAFAAANPSSPPDVLWALAWDPVLRASVASNPAITDDLRSRLDRGEDDAWAAARSLADVGELTARWLEGRILAHPGCWLSGPDDETGALAPVLAACNRAGFVTTNSQPGGPGQRPYLTGLAPAEIAERVWAALLPTRLVVLTYPPGAEGGFPRIPVHLSHGTNGGGLGGPHQSPAGVFDGCVGDEALAELRQAWTVEIIDPQWGDDDLLWAALAAAR
ncbi:MAG: hypothetical protein JNK12_12415 [Acidimicrobiales bacterium]|nr:hypothetical protein [Acidimicrobiales bacterium]